MGGGRREQKEGPERRIESRGDLGLREKGGGRRKRTLTAAHIYTYKINLRQIRRLGGGRGVGGRRKGHIELANECTLEPTIELTIDLVIEPTIELTIELTMELNLIHSRPHDRTHYRTYKRSCYRAYCFHSLSLYISLHMYYAPGIPIDVTTDQEASRMAQGKSRNIYAYYIYMYIWRQT